MQEREELLKWVQRWKSVELVMQKVKKSELPKTSTPQALLNLADAFESCRRNFSPRLYSGLIDQQKYFRKMLK
jgi:hypothetical protein